METRLPHPAENCNPPLAFSLVFDICFSPSLPFHLPALQPHPLSLPRAPPSLLSPSGFFVPCLPSPLTPPSTLPHSSSTLSLLSTPTFLGIRNQSCFPFNKPGERFTYRHSMILNTSNKFMVSLSWKCRKLELGGGQGASGNAKNKL